MRVSPCEGTALKAEFEANDAELEAELGQAPKDFAFTSTTWSDLPLCSTIISQRSSRHDHLGIICSKLPSERS